jgi:hypothetical protein
MDLLDAPGPFLHLLEQRVLAGAPADRLRPRAAGNVLASAARVLKVPRVIAELGGEAAADELAALLTAARDALRRPEERTISSALAVLAGTTAGPQQL